MEPYYITIFIFLAIGLVTRFTDTNIKKIVYITTILCCSLFFGSRDKVGVDWKNYIDAFNYYNTSHDNLSLEVGYKILNILAYKLDYGIQFVIYTTTCMVFGFSFYGLYKLKINPFYYLAITFPYFIVMGALNYTRQGVALGVFILAIYFILNKKNLLFIAAIIFACTFHVSIILFLPLIFIRLKKRNLLIITTITLLPFLILVNHQYSMYLNADFDSNGLLLRLSFVLLSSFLLVLNINTILELDIIYKRFFILSIASPILVLLLAVVSTTMADRICYYFILMSAICCFILLSKKETVKLRRIMPLFLFSCSFIIFITWSLYSTYIPYYKFQSTIFSGIF